MPEGSGREETVAVGPDSRGGAVDEGPGREEAAVVCSRGLRPLG